MPYNSTQSTLGIRRQRSVLGACQLLVLTALLLASATGCGRALKTVSLEHLEWKEPGQIINTPIELCLPPVLRGRQWNVHEHPYRIDLGPRTSINFEQMVKSVFSDVEVTLSKACGSRTGRPWITARIVAANRELYNETEDGVQYTSIRLDTEIRVQGGARVWRSDQTAVTSSSPVFNWWTRSDIAAEDFGAAIEQALQQTYEMLLDHEAVRKALAPATS
jgi:hypothetical protein